MTIKVDGIVASAMVEVGVFTCTSTAIWAIPAECSTFDENHALANPIRCFGNRLVVEVSVLTVVAGAGEWPRKAGSTARAPSVVDPVWEPLIGLQALSDIGIAKASDLIRWAVPDLLVFGVRENLNGH